MRSRFLSLSFILLIASCASSAPRFSGPVEFGPVRERQIFYALSFVKADDSQRAAILASFDATDPKLKGFADQSIAVMHQIQLLDPHRPDFLASAEPLARQRGDLESERLLTQAKFAQVVAETLTPEQFKTWNDLFQFRQDTAADSDRGDSDRGNAGGQRRRGGGI